MKLIPDSTRRLTVAHNTFVQLKERFNEFVVGMTALISPQSPLREALSIVPSEDQMSVRVAFATGTISFRLQLRLQDGIVPKGLVVCVLEQPIHVGRISVLGSFTFARNGTTDVELAEGQDPIDMEWGAPAIVEYFLIKALEHEIE